MPLVVRRVVEPSELLVAKLLVETGRLKAERVEPGGVSAAVARTGFRPRHQLASDPAPAQILGDPEVSDEEPPAISLPGETGNDRFLIADENTERTPRRMPRPSAFIEGFQPMRKNLDIGFARIVFDRQPAEPQGAKKGAPGVTRFTWIDHDDG
jgi:hypothetical protein